MPRHLPTWHIMISKNSALRRWRLCLTLKHHPHLSNLRTRSARGVCSRRSGTSNGPNCQFKNSPCHKAGSTPPFILQDQARMRPCSSEHISFSGCHASRKLLLTPLGEHDQCNRDAPGHTGRCGADRHRWTDPMKAHALSLQPCPGPATAEAPAQAPAPHLYLVMMAFQCSDRCSGHQYRRPTSTATGCKNFAPNHPRVAITMY